MTSADPRTLREWAAYIDALPDHGVETKARAASSYDFAAALHEELTPDEVETVFVLFARRLVRAGLRLPDTGLYDYRALATRALPVSIDDTSPTR